MMPGMSYNHMRSLTENYYAHRHLITDFILQEARDPKDAVYKAEVTWATIKKSAIGDDQVRYCPSWVAPRKKGRPKKDARKLGIADHVQQGVQKDVAKWRRRNTIVHQTIVVGVDENQAGIQYHGDIELEDTKDGVVEYV
jgi:hypothetical protein